MQRMAIQRGIEFESMGERSFTDLLAPLVDPAFRLACAMLHDPQAAEDAVQEASIIAWRKFAKLHEDSRARSWFLGIVANECRNARRHGWRVRVQIGLPSALSKASSEDRSVQGADLRRALLQLAHDDRLVVVLYYYFDMPLDEIASVARMSAAAARNRLYRTVRRLRPYIAIEEALR
jgi:RNA polymerase sigma-70 factor, ECF subfamily